MWHNAYNAYLESRVESADPLQLVRLLYQGAIAAVREARQSLAAGDVAARSRAISKAYAIVAELSSSLDPERGREIATRLVRLYDYIQRRLIEANLRQKEAPLTEVLGLLATLGEAWDGIQPASAPAAQPSAPAAQWLPVGDAPAREYSPAAWSF